MGFSYPTCYQHIKSGKGVMVTVYLIQNKEIMAIFKIKTLEKGNFFVNKEAKVKLVIYLP